jgi:hypothetical protein
MRSRLLVASMLTTVVFATGAIASGDRAPRRQWAAVYLSEPTLIGSTIVQGPVLFVHDEAKMARGEPCTTVQLFTPGEGPSETIASFHCIPRPAAVSGRFRIQTQPNTRLGYGCVLVEYQFAGDQEAHGVPTPADAH